MPETLYPWLNLAAGVAVVLVGLTVLRARAKDVLHTPGAQARPRRTRARPRATSHGHTHAPEPGSGLRGLLAVGVSGGILPCPSALVVLLAAISLHRVAFGLVLIVAFSAGLALSITGIGLVAVFAKRLFARASFDGLVIRVLPAVSALVILVAGAAMTARALPKVS